MFLYLSKYTWCFCKRQDLYIIYENDLKTKIDAVCWKTIFSETAFVLQRLRQYYGLYRKYRKPPFVRGALYLQTAIGYP